MNRQVVLGGTGGTAIFNLVFCQKAFSPPLTIGSPAVSSVEDAGYGPRTLSVGSTAHCRRVHSV